MDIKLDKPSFKARAYEDEYIEYAIYALDDSGEEDGVISGPHTSVALVEGILPDLIEDFPGEYFHVVAILRDGKDRLMDSEVVWSNYPDNESRKGESSNGANEKLSYEKGHKNSKGEDAPWVIRSHKDNRVLASFPTKKEAEDHMRTMKRYSKTEGRFTEIKAAIKAAWSAAEAKWFRLDFQESTERLDVYPIASDNEGVGVNWGVLPERSTIVQYATDYRTGNSEVEREMPYKDLDELEKIFVDEFKSMDETLEIGAANGADIHPLTESRPAEDIVIRGGNHHMRPEEPWERKSEATVLNRITMRDARKKCAALQKSGKLDNCLHEVTAAIALVQNALANSSPEIKDNTLNSSEKKIVARAVLAEIVSNFNYQPEDLR